MPRRGRSAGMSRAPAPAPVRRAPAPAPVPAHPPQSAPSTMQAQPRQPGLFAQMAATAGGVAIGSAVGHTIGHAMTGGGGGGGQSQEVAQPAAAPPAVPQATHHQYDPNQNPCQWQLQQFLECTQQQSDISLCSGFNEALKECKVRYGLQ